jgi:hypothetical protein
MVPKERLVSHPNPRQLGFRVLTYGC